MNGFLELLYGAGWPGMVVLVLGGLSFIAGVVAIVMLVTGKSAGGPKVLGLWALGLSVATFAMGGIGYLLGMSKVEQAVAYAAADQKMLLMEYGTREAFGCVWLAIYTASLPALLGLIAFMGGRARANRPDAGFQPPAIG